MAGFPKAGEEYGGRYRIVRELGHGGMGIVYEAVDNVLDRSIALKIVLPSLPDRGDYQSRFAREASALAKIRSRHIVGIHEYGEFDDTVYFVTELFPDRDLQRWLDSHGPLERRAALLLVAQVCEALADAHASGVVHRDVKPGNVLLWNRPEGLIPYLCDFGIAIDGKKGLTHTGALVGSPAYMAPERHFGHAADERGDIYSVGCLLWAVLAGEAPYSGTDFQMMNSNINDPAPQLGTGDPVDDRIDEVLAATMHKDPELRLATADEVQQRLMAIVREIDAQVAGVTSGVRPMETPLSQERQEEPEDPLEPEEPVEPEQIPVGVAVAPPPATAVPEPDSLGADEASERRQSGGWLVAAAVVALIVGGVTTAVGLTSGDRPPSPPSAQQTMPVDATASADAEPIVAPPPTPERPRVQSSSSYRAVTFAVRTPRADGGVEHRVEYDAGAGWQPAARAVKVPTEVGGERVCARFRTVAAGDTGEESTSTGVRACGRSAAPTVKFIRTDDPCINSIGGPCTWYDVAVTGLRSNISPLVNVTRANGAPWCEGCDFDRIQVGRDGRGYLRHDWKISRYEGEVIVEVAGVADEFTVFY